MIPQIPIQNFYYLLCYAWDVSDLQHKVKVDGDNCHSLENLLAMVLLNACDHLLRRGLIREYRYEFAVPAGALMIEQYLCGHLSEASERKAEQFARLTSCQQT